MKSLSKKIFLIYYGIIFLIFSLILFISYDTIKTNYIEMKKNELIRVNKSLLYIVGEENLNTNSQNFDHIIKTLGKNLELRLTVIQMDGKVIADSKNDPNLMENHANRPEILVAKQGDIRY